MGMPLQPQLDPKIFNMLMARRDLEKANRGLPTGSMDPAQFDSLNFGDQDQDEGDYAEGEALAQQMNMGALSGQDPELMGFDPQDPDMPNKLAEMEEAAIGPQPTIGQDKQNQMFKYGVLALMQQQMGPQK